MLQLLVIIIIIIIIIIVNKAKDDGRFGVVVGTKVKIPRVRDEEMFVRQSESHVYDGEKGLEQYAYMASNLYFEDDEIEGVEEGLMESMVGC